MGGTRKGTGMPPVNDRYRYQSTFVQWLKERRKALDITQEQLADHIGCARETIKKIELGERRPSRQVAEILARYFHVPQDEIAAFARFARSGPVVASPPWITPSASPDPENTAPWREQRRRHTNVPIP